MIVKIEKNIKVTKSKPVLNARYFSNCMQRLSENPNDREFLKKAAYSGVSYFNYIGQDGADYMDREKADLFFGLLFFFKTNVLGRLTPKEIHNIFPPDKEYDGERWSMKDYYTAMGALDDYPRDAEIGEDVYRLLMEYHNRQITEFMVFMTCLTSRLYVLQGNEDPILTFFKQFKTGEDHD